MRILRLGRPPEREVGIGREELAFLLGEMEAAEEPRPPVLLRKPGERQGEDVSR